MSTAKPAAAQLRPGDRVTWTTKWGDVATGVYEGPSEIPGLDGPIKGHNVRSDDCFGENQGDLRGVLCFVRNPTRIANDE